MKKLSALLLASSLFIGAQTLNANGNCACDNCTTAQEFFAEEEIRTTVVEATPNTQNVAPETKEETTLPDVVEEEKKSDETENQAAKEVPLK